MIRMQGKGGIHLMHNKGSFRPDADGFITVPPELEKQLLDLGFVRAPSSLEPAPAIVELPAAKTDAEQLADFEAEVLAAGYTADASKTIAAARLKSLREGIPYNDALAEIERRPLAPVDEPPDAANLIESPVVPIAPSVAPIAPAAVVVDDAANQALYDELVAGGADPAEAHELVWGAKE